MSMTSVKANGFRKTRTAPSGQLPQPVRTPGDKHEIHPDFSKASGEGFTNPR
jgi:hypothetical protein